MHRFVWDLHCTTPRAVKRSFPISAVPKDTPQAPLGPPVIPGLYRVRLEIDKRKWEQPLTILPDPRVSIGQQVYAAQFTLATGLAEALDASTAKAQEAKSLRSQLKNLRGAQGAGIAEQAKELDEHFDSLMEQGANAQPSGAHRGLERVNGDILSLYTQVLNADAAPTRAQQSAADSLFTEWKLINAASAKIWQDELAPFNQALSRAGLPTLRSDAAVPEEGESNDEE
jgi:hypothetical protein